MAGTDPFAAIPTSLDDLKKNLTVSEVDLNRIQSAEVQNLLRLGIVTPEQVTEYKRRTGTGPEQIPDTVAVPAASVTFAPGALAGHTQPDGPRLSEVVQRNFELSKTQRDAIANETGTSETGRVQNISTGESGATISDGVG